MSHFNALWITESPEKTYQREIIRRSIHDLPSGEVLIRVAYSSLNYKDALSASGNKGVTRSYPHTPGIDAAGVVEHSENPAFSTGDAVIVTGFDLGMNTAGGFAGYIRVPANWVVKLPTGLSLRDSMIYGTAGFTAALSIYKLEHAGLKPQQGSVLVTGSTGGVGSIAVAMLAKLGYHVIASSGKTSAYAFLKKLGASEILSREELQDASDKPMLKGRWAGVLDTVGGNILSNALKALMYGGKASCCGLVASPKLHTTVFPFILRGIDLLGIDSVSCPMEVRLQLWNKMAHEKHTTVPLEMLVTEASLTELKDIYLDKILQGQIQGRVVVKCSE